jgi:hypothetical protein
MMAAPNTGGSNGPAAAQGNTGEMVVRANDSQGNALSPAARNGTSGTPGSRGGDGSGPGGMGTGTTGEPGDGQGGGVGFGIGGSNPLAKFLPKGLKKKPYRPGSFSRRPLNLNRDWYIPIECRGDGVTLLTTQQHFTLAELAQVRDNPLLKTMRQMIDRRQARVPPDEPLYRPLIRFQVHGDGLRAYYLAYPVLDRLNVPMMREDLDPQLEVSSERYTR